MKLAYVLTIVSILALLAGCNAPVEKSPEMPMEDHQMDLAMKMHGGTQNSLDVMDFNIAFERPKAETGKNVNLTFTLTRQGEPLTELQIMHDKLMHVILVRKDLKHFDHIHPVQEKPGVFVVPYRFAAAGDYRVWSDFMYGNMQHVIDFDLSITGESEAEEPDRLNGLKVQMNAPELQEGKNATMTFTVTDADGKAVPVIEKFLAADGHIIIVDETLDEFEHAHDDTDDKNNLLSFEYTPEKTGKHKAWVQFNFDGNDRTAEFEFSVQKA